MLFDFDKSEIRADARPVLSKLASVIQAMPDVPVTIVGHTDSKGDDDYNQHLSQDRAASVEAWLTMSASPKDEVSADCSARAPARCRTWRLAIDLLGSVRRATRTRASGDDREALTAVIPQR